MLYFFLGRTKTHNLQIVRVISYIKLQNQCFLHEAEQKGEVMSTMGKLPESLTIFIGMFFFWGSTFASSYKLHWNSSMGLLTGITDSGASVFWGLVIYQHYGLSHFFVYIGIALTSFCRTALGRSTKLSVFPPCIISPFSGFVYVWVCLDVFRCFVFLSFFIVRLVMQIWILLY